MAANEQFTKEYHRYKDMMISHYDELLNITQSKSASMFLEKMKEIETQHKSIISNDGYDFTHLLSLTPTNELPIVSKVFDKVIEKKNEAKKDLSEIEKQGVMHIETRELLSSIIKNEITLSNNIRSIKQII